MRHLALLVLLVPALSGCTSLDVIKATLGIKPDGKMCGPYKEERADVWEAAREVLADEGYKFPKSDRTEWEMETDWHSYGSDFRFEVHRFRVTVRLTGDEDSGATMMELVVEKQSNGGNDPTDVEADAWEYEGADEDMQDQFAYMINKRLKGKVDMHAELMKRYEREANGRGQKTKPDYSNPDPAPR